MIGYIEGTLLFQEKNQFIIQTGGVGYIVFVPENVALPRLVGDTVSLWTYLSVRETALDLYGFTTAQERAFFQTLLGVSGIGPKGALAVLDIAPVPTLAQALKENDASYLTKVSGIGKKTAEKMVLELRDKMDPYLAEHAVGTSDRARDLDVLEALEALGYHPSTLRDLVSQIPADIETTEERITFVLRSM